MRAITHADPALAYAGGVVAGGVGGARHWFDSGGVRVGEGGGIFLVGRSFRNGRSI